MPMVCKKDGDEQIVYGEVYSPNRPDSQNEYMTRVEIRKMAHQFLRSAKCNQIDLMHGNKLIEALVPLSEMFGYVGDLRSKTSGQASYSMEFHSYAETPKSISDEIIQKARGE